MILFDSYDMMFDFLYENLPNEIKYRFLHNFMPVERYAIKDKISVKYGRKKTPYAVFLDLQRNGYAAKLKSLEKHTKTIDSERYILFWSKIEEAIEDNIFPNKLLEQYRLLSFTQASQFLNISRPTLYRLIKDGKIPVVEIFNKSKRIQMKDLLNYIESMKMK